jgi:hypothetical protein
VTIQEEKIMNKKYAWSHVLTGCFLLVFITGCTTAALETPAPIPTPTATTEPTAAVLEPSTPDAVKPTATLLEPTMTAAAEPTATPEKPSCDEVEGSCLELYFDGQSCFYEGPENMKTGPVTLIFLNNSDGFAADELLRLQPGHTYQEFIDFVGEFPTIVQRPPWAVRDAPKMIIVAPGGSYVWEGVLQPAIYALVCGSTDFGMWGGGYFTVEE